MKNLKTSISVLAMSGLIFTSCMDENKSKDMKDMDEENKVEMNSEKEDMLKENTSNSDTEQMMAYNKVTSVDGEVVERSINNDVKALQISGWDGFNELSIEMKKLEDADLNTMQTALPNFESTIASLSTTRPEWMMTEEISEDIEDLQKEYKALMSSDNTNEKKYKRDLEEVNEAYDDLVEEINETFDTYVKINRKANEKLNKNVDNAREKYNKEINKLNEVADDKK
ncbi:hypothetical protein CLV86_2364 [Lacinutrix venerupis]|uniref:hypothetical protein n=1 Tax=Lacinutrix venerupis TaxID=1486034 RepID=UPI000EAFE3B3|nr:hypothetical protein [Lacinutrix venerupis]RLJ61970.1 hypothetical protein CLV86_2364 [Lacinutrix venerupis]